MSEVKFTIIIQKRTIDVRLHNIGKYLPVLMPVIFLDEQIDVLESR